ncbi:MAG TPA: ABC transporter substrate-binding protein [Acidimicrobiales bacterium]
MAAPMRVGILNDISDDPSFIGVDRWIELAADDLQRAGRLDRDVELVVASGQGLPEGTAAAVERAHAELVDQDVLVVVGPAIGDNALAITPLVERLGVPTVNWSGAERARGELMFHLQVGSHEDESIVLARHLAGLGALRLGVVSDRSPIGRRHLEYLVAEAEVLGIQVAMSATVAPMAEEAETEVAAVLGGGVDAVVYLGLGLSAPAVAHALATTGWDGPRAMNTAGMRGHQPGWADRIEGWTYVDMYADDNLTLAALAERVGPDGWNAMVAAVGYDLARLVVEGLARAPERTRAGVAEGLEQVKWLPAAEGHEGTLLGFGVRDRGALHGRYLVLRQWRAGVSTQVS